MARTERIESDVVRNIKDYCKARGLKVRRTALREGVDTGFPDLMICIPRTPFFLEVKKPGEKPSPKQNFVMDELRAIGYDVDWCDNSADARFMIDLRLHAAS